MPKSEDVKLSYDKAIRIALPKMLKKKQKLLFKVI